MVTNEQKWLEGLKKGEDSAFQVLFETFYARLGAFACRFVEEQVVAEDIVQEVLYDLWLKKLHFKDMLALKAYLYRVVRHRCLDVLKHRKVEKKYFLEQRHKENSEFFLHQMLKEEVYILLKDAVAALPGQMGRVFALALDGHDNAEIAALLDITIDAVKAHKKRGKKLLQEKLRGLIFLYILFRI